MESILPPKSLEEATDSQTRSERDDLTDVATQIKYPPTKGQRDMKQAPQSLVEIVTGENQLTVPKRVPSLISDSDRMNREVFKDCQQFYINCKNEGMSD